jgi:hypothetical protein
MTKGDAFSRILRISWPLLGGGWGVWLGFGGYLRLPHNADSFGSVFALAFFSGFAWVGLVAGIAGGTLIGGSVERLLRRAGAGDSAAAMGATLVTVVAFWQVGSLLQAKYPGLRPPDATGAVTPVTSRPPENPCAGPPPEKPGERASWESECR